MAASDVHDRNLSSLVDALLGADISADPRATTLLKILRNRCLQHIRDPSQPLDIESILNNPDPTRQQYFAAASQPLHTFAVPEYVAPRTRANVESIAPVPAIRSTALTPSTPRQTPLSSTAFGNSIQKQSVPSLSHVRVQSRSLSRVVNGHSNRKGSNESPWNACVRDSPAIGPGSEPVEESAKSIELQLREASEYMEASDEATWSALPVNSIVVIAGVWKDGRTSFQKGYNGRPPEVLVAAIFPAAEGDSELGVAEDARLVFMNLNCQTPKAVLSAFSALLNRSDILKIMYDCKEMIASLLAVEHDALVGILPVENAVDLKISTWLLNPDLPRDGMDFTNMLLRTQRSTPSVQGIPQRNNVSTSLNRSSPLFLLSRDLEAALHLWEANKITLSQNGLIGVLLKKEVPVASILAKMENDGVPCDTSILSSQRQFVDSTLRELEQQAHDLAGKEFNIRSTTQLAQILFDDFKLPAPVKLASGHRSTSEDALLQLKDQHALPNIVLQYRSLYKLLHSYIDPLVITVSHAFKKGRIRTTWNMANTATGRLSSSNPNLQNLPREPTMVSGTSVDIRRAFQCAPGMMLCSADYSQMEVRVLAHLAGEHILLGRDTYRQLASKVFRQPEDRITSEQRTQAKTLCLAILYGMAPKALCQQLSSVGSRQCSVQEAVSFIRNFNSQFPKIAAFKTNVIKECRQQGFVQTMAGRRRYLPDIRSTDQKDRSAAERQAFNTIIQGSSADIVKAAMSMLFTSLSRRPKSARLLLQIHDEIVLECPREGVNDICRTVQSSMERNPLVQAIHMPVNVKIGPSLAQLSEWQDSELPKSQKPSETAPPVRFAMPQPPQQQRGTEQSDCVCPLKRPLSGSFLPSQPNARPPLWQPRDRPTLTRKTNPDSTENKIFTEDERARRSLQLPRRRIGNTTSQPFGLPPTSPVQRQKHMNLIARRSEVAAKEMSTSKVWANGNQAPSRRLGNSGGGTPSESPVPMPSSSSSRVSSIQFDIGDTDEFLSKIGSKMDGLFHFDSPANYKSLCSYSVLSNTATIIFGRL